MKTIRRTFIAGISVLVPIVATYYLLDVIFNVVDNIFGPLLVQYWNITSIWIRLAITGGIVFGLGLLTKTRLGSFFWRKINNLLTRVPLIKKIYGFAKDTTELMFEKKSFNTVVKVEFPMEGVYSIGFLTNAEIDSIFIPTTPNPTNGFYVMTKKYEILDTSVEDAIKQIMSMGAVAAKTFINKGEN